MALGGQALQAQVVASPAATVERAPGGDGPVLPEYVPYVPSDKDERGLWMQMDEGERSLKTSPIVIRDPRLNAYVKGVLCRLVGDIRCNDVRLYILRTAQFNASMAPTGVMQVYSGLLLRTQNEAQLAAVLAHEYVHFENRHSIKLFREIRSKSSAAVWLAFTGIGLIASFGLAASLFRYSREMEREADLGGMKLIAVAGYDTREAARIWEQLRAEMDATAAVRNTKSRKDRDGGIYASHPPTAERVAYLVEEAKLVPGQPGATMVERYNVALAPFFPTFVDDQLKLNDFGAGDYLLDAMSRADGWTPWLLYARGELYRRRSQSDDLAKAIGFYTAAAKGAGNLPEVWRGRGLALVKSGQVDEGRADLARYLVARPDAWDKSMISMIAGDVK